jgi:hypothetical protein
MIDPETGLVISYNYIWSHQHERGEDAGRKARPTCVVVPVTSDGRNVVLFPLTSKEPGPERIAVKVPETERRRLKLKGRGSSWIILDEGNADVLPGSFHIEPVSYDPLTPVYGKFSQAFMGQVLQTLAKAIRSKRMRLSSRTR